MIESYWSVITPCCGAVSVERHPPPTHTHTAEERILLGRDELFHVILSARI